MDGELDSGNNEEEGLKENKVDDRRKQRVKERYDERMLIWKCERKEEERKRKRKYWKEKEKRKQKWEQC